MTPPRKKPTKLQRYALHWSADVNGIQYVEAFDEEDAREQFDSMINEDAMPKEPVHAYLEDVEALREPTPKKGKK